MPAHEYQKIREIGSGSFGRAYLVQTATPPATRTTVADKRYLVLKEIDLSGRDAQQSLNAEVEVKVLNALKHPYIVRYWESFMNSHYLCIIMDYCEGGDLAQYISQCRHSRTNITEDTILRWLTQMCLALKYIHEKNVLHRDIKSKNVFLSKRGGSGELLCAKIADFGIAKILKNSQGFAKTLVGTPYYLSPEICLRQQYACPSDVWAVGCVLYELCALRVPFEAQELKQLVDRIVHGNVPRIPVCYSRELSELSADMLTRDASRRPTASAVLQRPMLQGEIKRMLAENRKEPGEENILESKRGRTPGSRGGERKEEVLHTERGHKEERRSSDHSRRPKPLGEHNQRTPSKGGSRVPSPHQGAAMEVLRPSRPPSQTPRR